MEVLGKPTLSFTCDFDVRTAWEVEQKGWFRCAVVILPNGLRIPVFFLDPIRLAQDLEYAVGEGRCCLAEPGLIIVPSVTREAMERAVSELFESKYFDCLIALGNGGGASTAERILEFGAKF